MFQSWGVLLEMHFWEAGDPGDEGEKTGNRDKDPNKYSESSGHWFKVETSDRAESPPQPPSAQQISFNNPLCVIFGI